MSTDYKQKNYKPKKNFNNQKKTNDNKESVSLDFSSLNFSKEDMYNMLREYKSYYYESNRGMKYDKQQIRRFLENPQQYERQIREVSLYLAGSSSHYVRLILYLSTMLTLDHLVVPIDAKMSKSKMLDRYTSATSYIDAFNVKHELSKIIPTILIEDIFYGYESRANGTSTIRKLPANYCKIVGVEDGIFIFAFNFTYFNGKEHLLRDYPKEFKILFNKAKQTGNSWQELNPNLGAVCFKFRDDLTYGLPLLAPLFEEVIELESKKDRANEKEELENFKLLVQKIPMKADPKSEKDYVLTLPTVKKFHSNIKTALPKNVGLISTPMEIEDYSFERKTSADNANLSEAQDVLFTSAGFGNIFSATNKSLTALKNANLSDQSLMFKLLRQFERFFNARLKTLFGKDCGMTVWFLDITIFNREDKINEFLKLAQFGLPKSTIAVATGMSQSQFLGLNALEEHLELEDKLVPLNSSHTQNQNAKVNESKGATEDGGHPTSEQEEKNKKEKVTSTSEENTTSE